MIGFSLAHGEGAILFLFPILLAVWTVGVTATTLWGAFKRRKMSPRRWIAIGGIVLLFLVGTLPEGFWQRAFISRMASSPHSADLMLYAAYRSDLATIEGLMARGVPVDAQSRADWRTALHGAAWSGDTDSIRFLASKGADLNRVDRFGDSALELALSNHQDTAAGVLAGLGAKKIQGDQAQRDKAIKDQVQETINGFVR